MKGGSKQRSKYYAIQPGKVRQMQNRNGALNDHGQLLEIVCANWPAADKEKMFELDRKGRLLLTHSKLKPQTKIKIQNDIDGIIKYFEDRNYTVVKGGDAGILVTPPELTLDSLVERFKESTSMMDQLQDMVKLSLTIGEGENIGEDPSTQEEIEGEEILFQPMVRRPQQEEVEGEEILYKSANRP